MFLDFSLDAPPLCVGCDVAHRTNVATHPGSLAASPHAAVTGEIEFTDNTASLSFLRFQLRLLRASVRCSLDYDWLRLI